VDVFLPGGAIVQGFVQVTAVLGSIANFSVVSAGDISPLSLIRNLGPRIEARFGRDKNRQAYQESEEERYTGGHPFYQALERSEPIAVRRNTESYVLKFGHFVFVHHA
jgi:hypothetical protein